MKPVILFAFCLWCTCSTVFGQITFEFKDYPSTEFSSFADVQLYDDHYYLLSTHVSNELPQNMTSELWILDQQGQLLEKRALGEVNQQYFKIIDKQGPVIRMAGAIQQDTCKAIAMLAEYNLDNGSIMQTSTLPLCYGDRVIKRMTLVKGLNHETFIEYSNGLRVSPGFEQRSGLLKIDDGGQLAYVIEQYQFPGAHLTYDFKGTGYLVMETWHMKFYTADFTFRKDRYNAQSRYRPADFSYPQPFAKNMILDMADLDYDIGPGCAIRLIDSHFHIQRELIIPPVPGYYSGNNYPAYGGIHVLDDSTAWLVSNFGGTVSQDDTYFSVAKLDDELNILCQHYYGFGQQFQIEGIYPTPDEGLFLYGHTERSGPDQGIHNVYALKIGGDCLTTSTHYPASSLHEVIAFPNPTNNTIHFTVDGIDPSDLRCEFYDVSGKVVQQVSDLRNEIRVAELPQGHYFYRIMDDNKLVGVGSWVKQ